MNDADEDQRNADVDAMTQVRTVRSRALTAIDKIEAGYVVIETYFSDLPEYKHHPESEEMIKALQEVVRILEPWSKKR